jgi:hypothetical protein
VRLDERERRLDRAHEESRLPEEAPEEELNQFLVRWRLDREPVT